MNLALLARNSIPPARRFHTFRAGLTAAALLLATASCTSVCNPKRPEKIAAASPAMTATQMAAAEEYAARTTNRFQFARFLKPAERSVEDLAFKLAPLILQQILTTNLSASNADRFGRLACEAGEPSVDLSRPVVYVQLGVVTTGNTPHPQFTYAWFYPPPAGKTDAREVSFQGARITLDSTGRPAIWEVLTDPADLDVVYVAHSLESAAAAAFGEPLPGRRHAIERARAETPRTVVARVIDDGPVPMGPIVYLTPSAREVSTLICRCMPAQADTIVETQTYQLLPLPAQGLDRLGAPATTAILAGNAGKLRRLEELLRLPGQW